MNRTTYVAVLLALCLGISACSDKGPTAPGPTVLATVYVPSTTTVVQGKTVDLEPTLNGKNVQPTGCSTSAGTTQVVFDPATQKHLVRVTALVVGTDHKVICSVSGASDGFAKVTVTEAPLVFDIEYSWDTPTVIQAPYSTTIQIATHNSTTNTAGNFQMCSTVWTPSPSTANTWRCSSVSFERNTKYYVRVIDVKRYLSCDPDCGSGFGERVKVGGVLLTRIMAYFVDTRGMVQLDFDQNGKPY